MRAQTVEDVACRVVKIAIDMHERDRGAVLRDPARQGIAEQSLVQPYIGTYRRRLALAVEGASRQRDARPVARQSGEAVEAVHFPTGISLGRVVDRAALVHAE